MTNDKYTRVDQSMTNIILSITRIQSLAKFHITPLVHMTCSVRMVIIEPSTKALMQLQCVFLNGE